MDYYKDLLKKMELSDWPDFDRNAFLYELHSLANDVYEKKTTEGYLASLLIYQQLSEEILRLIIRYSNLLLQFSVLPREIKERTLDGKTFGQLIGELENGLCEDKTRDLIETCKEFNALRNRLVHRITLKTSVRDIQRQASGAKKLYDKIYDLFDNIRDDYRVSLSKYSDDYEEYKELVEEYLKENKQKKKPKKKSRRTTR